MYLVSFRPLCYKKRGYTAIREHGQKPFVDHSIRREPELESSYPSISSICRASKLAPKLQVGDVVVYITVKKHYPPLKDAHRRLVAILEVLHVLDNHQAAAEWYRQRGLGVPTNCILSAPLPLELTVRNNFDDCLYRYRARRYPQYAICQSRYLNVVSPPALLDVDFKGVFGRVPGTESPPHISQVEMTQLLAAARPVPPV